MSIALLEAIAAYFRADRRGGEAIAHCFTANGAVKDEGHLHTGPDAIGKWKADASAKYNYTSEPISIDRDGGRILVTARVTGDFPGSPVELRYGFTLDGGKIALLEIAP